MCVLISSTAFIWNSPQYKKNWARYDKKMYIVLHVKYRYPSPILMKLEFSRHFSEKILKYKISWYSV
jgi:hypothetical protein